MLSFKQYLKEEFPERLVEFAKDERFWFNSKTKKLIKIAATYHDWEPVLSPEKFGLKQSQVEEFEAAVERGRDVIPGVQKLMRVRGWMRLLIQKSSATLTWSIQGETLSQVATAAKALSKKNESPGRLFIDYGRKSEVLLGGQIEDFIKTGKIIQRTEIGATMARFR